MLVIWWTFLGELEEDEKNILYVAVSRAKKSLRLNQKIMNLIHLQKVLSLITTLSCCFLVVCFLSKCTTYFLKKKVSSSLFTRPRLSVFRISYLREASSNRSILASNIKETDWLKKSCYTWNYGQAAVKYCYPARDKKLIRCRCKFPFLSIHMYAFERRAFSITSWLWRVF